MATDTTNLSRCPECQAQYRVALAHAGRITQCHKCQTRFRIQPLQADSARASDIAEKETGGTDDAETPTHVGVNCRLCGTRMYGRLRQVGQKLTCPDCKSQTVLPPPRPRRPPTVPAAMQGEQYELWEEEEQPWGSRLAAEQEQQIRVCCELCDTLQYAGLELVGAALVCPDCGHATRVPQPPPTPPPTAPALRELELHPPQDFSSTEDSQPPAVYSRLHDFNSKSSEEQEREIARVATNRKARPQMPRWPLLSGWLSFLRGPDVVARWITLSILLPIFGAIAAMGFSMLFSGYGAIMGLPMMCAAAAGLTLCFGAAAACAIAIITESSEGNDHIMAWPSNNPIDWMGEAIYLLVTLLASAAPGYLLVQLAGPEPSGVLLGMLVSAWVLLPVILLSTLEGSSPFALVMPGVVGSLRDWIGSWALFYLLSAAFMTAAAVALGLLASQGVAWLSVGGLVLVGVSGAYFRLLGRLAWRVRHEE